MVRADADDVDRLARRRAGRPGRPTARRWPRSTRACWRSGRWRATGEPLGPPRRVTTESAHSPSWQGDSRHILYQSLDKLRIVDIETGETRDGAARFEVHAGGPHRPPRRARRQADRHEERRRRAPTSTCIIEGNRITSVVPHADAQPHGGQVVDASNLTVMPGLTEFHSHLQKDFGEAQGRAWLAFGITTVRSPGNTPYEAVEEREANEAGVRPGPRVYGTGYLMEWQRVYYKMGIAISSVAQFEMELQRAKVLQHDLIKSYVRLPDLQQKRMVEFAHSIGVPVATHEIYPAAFVGVDNTEHTSATSRRGYSPKMATLQRAYEDVDPAVRQERADLLPDDFGRRRAQAVRARAGPQERSALQAVSRTGSRRRWRRSRRPPSRRRRRSGRRQRQDGARHHARRRADRRRHRHAERDQPARRADGVHAWPA